MSVKSIVQLGPMLTATIKAYGEGSERSIQSAEGRIGPSDLGFCRNKAALMTKGVEQSDSTSIAAAQIGTAVHAYIADALRMFFPQWIVDSQKVTATFPSGAQVSGTPDIIAPDFNAVIDVKTVDGFEWVRRTGTSQNHKMQRHAYALGAIQAGLLDDSEDVYVGNLYIDRSGKEHEPLFIIEQYDPMLTAEIDSWIDDVMYAVKTGEDASRDIPAPICERICNHFTVCRGGLPVADGQEFIDAPELVEALHMYIEARDTAKEAEAQKKAAQRILDGVNGTDGEWQVRWVRINATSVAASERPAYDRMDVRKVKRS